MSALEFREWQAYDVLSPIGRERFDILIGLLASVQANLQRDPRQRSTPFTAADFMPHWYRPSSEREAQWKQQKAALKALAKMNQTKQPRKKRDANSEHARR